MLDRRAVEKERRIERGKARQEENSVRQREQKKAREAELRRRLAVRPSSRRTLQ